MTSSAFPRKFIVCDTCESWEMENQILSFESETAEDITLSQFLGTLESEIELKDINVDEVFDDFGHFPSPNVPEADPGPFEADVQLGTFFLGDVDFLVDNYFTHNPVDFNNTLDTSNIPQEPEIVPKIETTLAVDIEPKIETTLAADIEPKIETTLAVVIEPKIETTLAVDIEPKIETTLAVDIEPKIEKTLAVDIEPKIETTLNTSRFTEMSETEIDQLIKDTENKNTQKSTKWAANLFEDWKNVKITSGFKIPELKDFTVQDVNELLVKFIVEVRKKDGEQYPPKTLYLIVCGILREMRRHGVHNLNFLNESDDRFLRFKQVLDAQMKRLTSQGYGINIKQADLLSIDQETALWEKDVFGEHSSESLLHTVFFYNCKLFGLRGRDEHRKLQVSQIQLGEDNNGNYIEFRGKDNKTYNGGLRHRYIAPKHIKHHVEEDSKISDCYKTYLNAISEIDKSDNAPFYRRPSNEEGTIKFDHVLGANRLGSLMKAICQKGELKGNFTNHSGKRTLATRLYQSGVSEQMIMERTGHRSEKAVRAYKRPAESMLMDVSNILNPQRRGIKRECPTTATDKENSLAENSVIESRSIKRECSATMTEKENMTEISVAENSKIMQPQLNVNEISNLPFNSSFQNCVFNFGSKM